jgi:hypothetical protein
MLENENLLQQYYPYLALWRSILLESIKNSAKSKESADANYEWAISDDCKLVCNLANWPYDKIKNYLIRLSQFDDIRIYTYNILKNYNSRKYLFKIKEK